MSSRTTKGSQYCLPSHARHILQALSTARTIVWSLVIVLALSSRSKRARDGPFCLALAPTRELAKQVAGTFQSVAPDLHTVVVYGGADYNAQRTLLRKGVHVLVATPGVFRSLPAVS